METLSIVPTTENVKMFISIEQGDYKHEAEFSFNDLPKLDDVAKLTLNEVYSFLTIQKLLVSQKQRPSMGKPFTFALAFEQGDKSAVLSDFSTKVTFGEKAQEKLIKNMPKVLATLLVSKTLPVRERLQEIEKAGALTVVLS